MELRFFGDTGRDGDKRRAPAGVGAYADAKVAVMSSSHSEKEAETLSSSEPGLQGPWQGPRARAYIYYDIARRPVVPVMDRLDRLVMDRLLKNTGHVDRSR